MPRIYPTDWKTQIKIFELFGCKYKRKEGSHHVLTCHGANGVKSNIDDEDYRTGLKNLEAVY